MSFKNFVSTIVSAKLGDLLFQKMTGYHKVLACETMLQKSLMISSSTNNQASPLFKYVKNEWIRLLLEVDGTIQIYLEY